MSNLSRKISKMVITIDPPLLIIIWPDDLLTDLRWLMTIKRDFFLEGGVAGEGEDNTEIRVEKRTYQPQNMK